MLGIFVLTAVILWLTTVPSLACTTVLVGKDVSDTGEVLVGHNEDSSGRYVMRTHIVPALVREKPETIRFEPNAAVLALPAERPKLFWAEARPYIADGGASFCDSYINGYGVVLCSDNCGKPKEENPELTEGGIGYGVRRLVAETARSAYNAVEVAASLVDKYGYLGNGRSYHFADKNEIWVFQVVNGKNYAVKRVRDDEVYVNPNHYTIRRPDPETPGLEKLIAYAAERGWYDPAKGDFDFARAYQAPDAYRSPRNVHRHRRGLEIILGRPVDPEAELPFSVKPARKIGVEDIKKVLRCHFEGTPEDISNGDTPHFMETRPVCAGTTLESYVVQIRQNHDMTLIWRVLGRPCITPYSPWYFGIAEVGREFAGDPEEAVRTHFSVAAAELDYSKDEAWFHYTDLQGAADPLYREKAGEVKDAVAKFEEKLHKEVRYFEPIAQGHFKTDPDKARGLLTGSVADWASRTLNKLDKLYATLDVLPIELPKEIDVNNAQDPILVQVSLPDEEFGADEIVLGKTLFGPHYASPAKRSQAVNAATHQGKLCLSFKTGDWVKGSTPCLTDMWLVMENKKGKCLVGKALTLLSGVLASEGDQSLSDMNDAVKGGTGTCDCGCA